MEEKIICPNLNCRSSNIEEKSYEGEVGARGPGKPLPRSKKSVPRYKCLDCGHEFDRIDL